MKKAHIILIAALLFASLQTHAAHIVGGVIYYEWQAGNTFTVTMKIYRDCAGGGADFDDPATIGVFDEATGLMVESFEMNSPLKTNIPSIITNPCMIPPTGICVEEGVYTTNYTVPDATKNYLLVYQRCCRNAGITNLTTPSSEGATYIARIPRTDLYHNSSPVYTSFPPLFICQGAPLVFNHSAIDADGDSLYYSTCTPFHGGSTGTPAPVPPDPPPYTLINFLAPYSSSNPMGGPFTINATSGVLTATPPTLGKFVVGICVSEFRAGVLLSTTLRDFQFNVASCNIPIANIPSFDINPLTGIGYYTINCNDFTVDFTHTSSGAVSYHWDFGITTSTSDTSNLSAPTFTYPDTGTYLVTLIARNTVGCADTTYAYVKFYPIFTPGFTFDERCLDSATVFTDTSSATTSIVNSWYWTFGDGDTSTSQNPAHRYSFAGTYFVNLHVTTDKGCEEDVLDTITVFPLPNLSFTTGNTCVGQPVLFNNTSTGTITSYFWDFGDGGTSSLTNPSHTYLSTGLKTVTLTAVTDRSCKDTLRQTINVHALPAVDISPRDTLICDGSSVRLIATAGLVSYLWTPAATLSNSTISNPVATPVATTTYHVFATDVNGCVGTDTSRVRFFPPPPAAAGPDTSVCLNPGSFVDSVQLNGSGGIIYQWAPVSGLSNPNIPNPVCHPDSNTTYVLAVTDTNGCTAYDSVRVTVLDPSIDLIVALDTGMCRYDSLQIPIADQGVRGYQWVPSASVSDATVRSPWFFPTDTTLFILTVSNYCYVKSDSFILNVFPLPTVDCGDLDSVCYGESYQLQATGAASYLWDADTTLSALNISNPVGSPYMTQYYKVTGTDTLGCQNRDSIRIIVYPLPNISITDPPSIICLGDNVSLHASGGWWYSWTPSLYLNDSSLANPVSTPLDTITYQATAINIHGCTNSDSITLNVQQPIQISIDSFFEICQREVAVLSVSGGKYFYWYPDYNLDNIHSPTPSVYPDTSFTYYVRVSNDCFSDTASAFVLVHPLPTVSGVSDTTIIRGQSVRLHAEGGISYRWWPNTSLDDGFAQNPLATPIYTTTYVTFITDENGCDNSDSVIVRVLAFTNILIPTAFTPNADGVNDLFRPLETWNLQELESLVVFNRWGQLIYETNDLEEGWDGTFKGVPQEMGVYVWVLRGKDYDGQQILEHGNVSLLR